MNKSLNFVIIGCGRISKKYCELLTDMKILNARLCAVCDKDVNKAEKSGEKYNVPFYSDMDNMLKDHPETDIICILTPSGYHAEHVINMSKYHKHIIVEKPMALTLDDADRMIKSCDANGIKLFVVKQNRFNIPVKKLREAIENNRFGKLVLGTVRVRWCRTQQYYDMDDWRGTWELDGGVLTNQASHHIDLLEWMMGDVESVFAKSTTALVDIEVEDTAVVTIRFRNGALGIIEATTATRPKDLEGSISILGENGTVEIGGFAVNEMKTWQFSDSNDEEGIVLRDFSCNPPDVYGFGHKEYLEHVIDCIKNNKKALVDGLEGRRSLELIMAIYESIETGKEVFLRFKPKLCRLGLNAKEN